MPLDFFWLVLGCLALLALAWTDASRHYGAAAEHPDKASDRSVPTTSSSDKAMGRAWLDEMENSVLDIRREPGVKNIERKARDGSLRGGRRRNGGGNEYWENGIANIAGVPQDTIRPPAKDGEEEPQGKRALAASIFARKKKRRKRRKKTFFGKSKTWNKGKKKLKQKKRSCSNTCVSFYVVGDVPYSAMEACLLPFELKKMDPSQGQFVIHLGDIRDGRPDPHTGEFSCPESLFQDVSTIFESSDITPFFIPGDNGWLDCANATEAYEYWEQYLFTFNERTDLPWPTFPTTVNRWTTFPQGVARTTRRSEFFSFLLDSVLFVGLSLPGSGRNKNNEWRPRDGLIQDNIEWTRENFDAYSNVLEAVVLFGHASATANEGYLKALPDIVRDPAYGRPPVLFLEDNHFINVKEKFRGAPNLLQIELDDTVTPMRVTVDPSAKGLLNIFQYNRGCVCSTDHRPTQLITYRDSHRCGGQCNKAITACRGENTCSPEGATCPSS